MASQTSIRVATAKAIGPQFAPKLYFAISMSHGANFTTIGFTWTSSGASWL